MLHRWIDTGLYHSTAARFWFRQYCKLTEFERKLPPPTGEPPIPSLEDGKYEAVLARLGNDLTIWGALARGMGARFHYVLQPVVGWTDKRPSVTEQKIMAVDRINIPSLARYANREFHHHFAADVRQLCQTAQIDFHDANAWVGCGEGDGRSLFTDVCHLTDEGSEILARYLDTNLRWNERVGDGTGSAVAFAGK